MENINSTQNDDYDYLIKLLALGDSSVGKTSLLHRYTDDEFTSKFVSTVGVDFKQKRIVHQSEEADGVLGKTQKLQLQLWDTAGQERFRSLSMAFFRDAMGFLLVYDVTNEQSFLHIRNWVTLLRSHAYCDTPDMILVGNKTDLLEERQVSLKDAEDLAEFLGIPYIETSALSGDNVEKAFDQIVVMVMKRIERSVDKSCLPVRRPAGVSLQQKSESKADSNCWC